MLELEGGHRNSVKKRLNTIELGLVWFVSTRTLCLYSIQGLMMESQGVHRNSVMKRHNPSLFESFDLS